MVTKKQIDEKVKQIKNLSTEQASRFAEFCHAGGFMLSKTERERKKLRRQILKRINNKLEKAQRKLSKMLYKFDKQTDDDTEFYKNIGDIFERNAGDFGNDAREFLQEFVGDNIDKLKRQPDYYCPFVMTMTEIFNALEYAEANNQ